MRIVHIQGLPDASLLEAAAACVAAGGTLIFPTDTVYGIGCAAESDAAVETIFAAKRRPATKPLAIHVAQPEDAFVYAKTIGAGARSLAERFWPGPLTIIVVRDERRAAAAARGGATIALRCPDAPVCAAILRATGPLAATSANVSGAPAYAGEEGLDALPDAALAIIAGPTKERRESTVLDCSTDTVRLVRAGALEPARIAAVLAGVAPFEASARQ